MSSAQFDNNATSTLGSSVSSTTTTIVVATGTGTLFPTLSSGQYFMATMWSAGSTTGTPNEIVKVTGRSGDTMTVVRAQEGTTATTWNVGDTFANYPTAGFLNGLAASTDIQNQAFTFAPDTGAANAYVIALSPAVSSLSDGMMFSFRPLYANTGSSTLAVGSASALPIKTPIGQQLAAGAINGGIPVLVQYSAAEGFFIMLSEPGAVVEQAQNTANGTPASTSYVDRQAASTLSSAETYAASEAATAQSNAETFATGAANTAQSNAETFATGAANTAQSNAEAYTRSLIDEFSVPSGASIQQESSGGGSLTPSIVFTPPVNGALLFQGSRNNSAQDSSAQPTTLYLNGSAASADNTKVSITLFGYANLTGGTEYTIELDCGAEVAYSANLAILFVPYPPTF